MRECAYAPPPWVTLETLIRRGTHRNCRSRNPWDRIQHNRTESPVPPATHEGVAHDREIAADTVEDAISLTRWFSYHQKTYLESGEVNHTDAMLDKIVEFVGRKPDGATAREVQQRIRKTAKITRMYLDKLVPGRLTCVEVPPPKEKGGHTKVIYRLPE
jgi:hypothetical protein